MIEDREQMTEKLINLHLSDYEEKGIYLIFQDATHLILTKENIEKATTKFWEDPSKIPPEIKEVAQFQRCEFCPLRKMGGFCDALRPILPFLDILDRYVSFDKVTALYKPDEKELLHISDTTMQEALKYVSILSLTEYCQAGQKYKKYFWGIIPIMNAKNMSMRLYLNIYWLHKGEKGSINKLIAKFKEEITLTSQNQARRLNFICKNDAFLNAFVATQVTTEFLSMDIERITEESFANFGKLKTGQISQPSSVENR